MSEFKLQNGPQQDDLPTQAEMEQQDLFAHLKPENKPVTCLGQTFPNDAARREHFTRILAEKLKDPEFRKIEGFPIGKDEDILALSDPPYYCACPNPWLNDFIKEWEAEKPERSAEKYEREPFAADVSEGKNDPIYNAHSYHTKVPHKAIMRYILHYTEPGDIVFDGFCGTGMTGVAAQLCGDRKTVESLGYKVDDTGNITDPKADDPKKVFSHLGARKAVLNDLSPAATFIAYNYNTPVDVVAFEREAKRILAEVEKECGWMYETQHVDKDGKPILGMDGKPALGRTNYVVWSDIFICPHCMKEFSFWDGALDAVGKTFRKILICPHCDAEVNKGIERSRISAVSTTGNIEEVVKQQPILIVYTYKGKRYKKRADAYDTDVTQKIDQIRIGDWFPSNKTPPGNNTDQPRKSHGINRIDQFYWKRTLAVLARIRAKCSDELLFALTGILLRSTRMNRIHVKYFFHGGGGWNAGYLKGTLYVPALPIETSVFEMFADRVHTMVQAYAKMLGGRNSALATMSLTNIHGLQDNSVDYVFIDPPFGQNINYSELNCIWEGWLKVATENAKEAIENDTQGKGIVEYRRLMAICFSEVYRVLKNGRWAVIEFSNTSASVWNSIQSALNDAGFIVANVSALDKKQGSFKAVTTTTAVKQDLVISAYKPDSQFEQRFNEEASTEDGVWDFVRSHLEKLPVSKMRNGLLHVVPERDPRILFDRVVAYYVRNGLTVPISAKEFQDGLAQRFDEADGMYFLSEQLAEYQKQKAKATKFVQAELFVCNEETAIGWLRARLKERPQVYQDINPDFMQQLKAWNKYETQLELKTLLEENFLCYDGCGDVPGPIHAYLSTNFKDMRNLAADDDALKVKALDFWYVPDPRRSGEVEKLRERALLREFETYREAKKLKSFRLEAIRAGFRKYYEAHDYATILAVGKKIPESVIEEDEKLLMYYDHAQLHLED